MEEKKTDAGKIVLIIAIVIRVFTILFSLTMFGFAMIMSMMVPILAIHSGYIEDDFVYLEENDVKLTGFKNKLVTDFNTYYKMFNESDDIVLTREDFKESNYYIFEIGFNQCGEQSIDPTGYDIEDDVLVLHIDYTKVCRACSLSYRYYALKLPKTTKIKDYRYDYRARNNYLRCPYQYAVEDKPMIYIYPEKDMDVEVKLGHPELLLTSYPKYEKSWKVFAKTNGELDYNGRTYYGLYWEGSNHNAKQEKDGFVIKGEDTSKFLEEKLEILGLNEREINEFIIYWLPKMEHNKYNYIRFETREEIDSYMPLYVSPSPDSVIRVYIDFKGLDEKIEVKEQQLEKNERYGYSVIEWGGSELYE